MSKKKKKKSYKKVNPSGRLLSLKQSDKLDGYKDFIHIGSGKGGFTMIYSALKSGGARVALKLFTFNSTDSFQQKLRFEKFKNEAPIMKELETHDHIVVSLDDEAKSEGLHNGNKAQADYFTMELLGGSLTSYIEDVQGSGGEWSLDSKLDVLIQICKAIEHAHVKGVFHRDLYADNVLLVDYSEPLHAKVADFGAAHFATLPSSQKYYQPVGARTVCSPEMIAGLVDTDDLRAKADVFSLGLMIYDLIMEASHNYEAALRMMPPAITTMAKPQRQRHLDSIIVPYLQNLAQQSIIISNAMPSALQIEVILNKVFMDATALEHSKRLSSAAEIRQQLESCKDLINA